ncbi:hypothetical protein Trco_008540 [Trichoderma cornu-damae]|uniref:Uncharacterized protein n=1 Tax=Trichoderma cornu-damae TaxID=654480 RepID=A0A9P8QI32_9HYPO|nr:hypothetical protein Trco_008540 [Trichoderma cornu-damae]
MCPATLWFRLVFMDRYLSLVLCLPMAVGDDSFMQDLVGLEPQEELERIQGRLTGRIISRNEMMRHGSRDHCEETRDIDYMLKQAARSLPADWWALPRWQDARTSAQLKDATVRIARQMHHYDLVLLLHIPYVVPGSGSCPADDEGARGCASSKLAATIAGRELLARAIVPAGPNRASSSTTRANVLKILLSALALLLAHLDSHRLGRENTLDHQRPGDLSLVGRAIGSLESVARKHGDTLCSSATRALVRLSAIEATAAEGAAYRTWSEPGSSMAHTECTVREEDDGVEMLFPTEGCRVGNERQAPPSGSGTGRPIGW